MNNFKKKEGNGYNGTVLFKIGYGLLFPYFHDK